MIDFDAAALAYVRYVLEQLHASPHGLAANAGVAPSTISRALNMPTKYSLTMKTVEKVAKYSGIDPTPFLQARDVADLNTGHIYDVQSKDLPGYKPEITMMIGTVEANRWAEYTIFSINQFGPLSIRHSQFKPNECFGVFVRGPSSDMIAADGEILFCVRLDAYLAKYGALTRFPTAVVVESRRRERSEFELSCRILVPSGRNQWILRNASEKREYFKPVIIEDLATANSLEVIGIVELVMREPEYALRNQAFSHG